MNRLTNLVLCRSGILFLGLVASADAKPFREQLRPVVVQLKWTHSFQFAGYYAAIQRGLYEKAGLRVELREAQPDTDPVREVVAGTADIGIGLSNLLLERARGRPVKLLANVFQHSAFALALRPGLSEASPATLRGKRIMLDTAAAELVAALAQEGVERKDYTIIPHTFGIESLLEGQIDAMSIYLTDDAYLLAQRSNPCVVLTPRSSGIDFYGDNIFTSEDFAAREPDTVAAFVAASLAGWQYALAHEEELVDLILSDYPQTRSRDHLLYEAARIRELIMPDVIEIGYVNAQRWQAIAGVYAELGMLPDSFALDGFLPDAPPAGLPRWVFPTLLATAFAAVLGLGIVGYVVRINRQLGIVRRREAASHAAAERTLEQKLRAALTASAIAHEIQQPLGRLQLAAAMADMKGSWSTTSLASLAGDVRRISQTVDKMNVLLRSVQTPHSEVDLCNAVQSSLHQVRGLAEEHRISIRASTPTGQCIVKGDEIQLQLMLVNLLRNAIEAIASCSPTVRTVDVNVRRTAEGVQLEVGDSGPGWPGGKLEDYLLRSSKPHGTGIGLFIALATVENHGGSIAVTRAPAGGALFQIVLPTPSGSSSPSVGDPSGLQGETAPRPRGMK